MLALANSQGGFIVFGVAENEDKSIRAEGLSEPYFWEVSKFLLSRQYDILHYKRELK